MAYQSVQKILRKIIYFLLLEVKKMMDINLSMKPLKKEQLNQLLAKR